MPIVHAAVMFIAALCAGVVNSIAGGGMLLVFPTMIWLGLDPKIANATCTVALVPGLFGGLFGYRREMNDSSLMLMRLGATSVIGGGLGAGLPDLSSFPNGGIPKELVGDRDYRAVFFRDVRRIFWRRQRNLDVGGDGTAGPERHSSREWHQEFLRHLHQQRCGNRVFDHSSGLLAASVIHGGRGNARRILWRAHRAKGRSNIHQTRNRGHRIGDYDGDAVGDEMKR